MKSIGGIQVREDDFSHLSALSTRKGKEGRTEPELDPSATSPLSPCLQQQVAPKLYPFIRYFVNLPLCVSYPLKIHKLFKWNIKTNYWARSIWYKYLPRHSIFNSEFKALIFFPLNLLWISCVEAFSPSCRMEIFTAMYAVTTKQFSCLMESIIMGFLPALDYSMTPPPLSKTFFFHQQADESNMRCLPHSCVLIYA